MNPPRRKIRFKTWFWGKFIHEGDYLDGSRITLKDADFEPYIEAEHGWQHSEEYKNELHKGDTSGLL